MVSFTVNTLKKILFWFLTADLFFRNNYIKCGILLQDLKNRFFPVVEMKVRIVIIPYCIVWEVAFATSL